MSSLSDELRGHLRELGSDLIGFGRADDMEGAPETMSPRRYVPDAVSLVSIGLHINEASCDLIARSVRERIPPSSYYSYQAFTLAVINRELDRIAYLCAKFLEKRGFRAYPFPANMPHGLKPSKAYPGGSGDISHVHVAAACGLGEIGWHSLLVTPQYGARQKLVSVVTNAHLSPDPAPKAKLCDPAGCGLLCADACPTMAIPKSLEKKVSVRVGGRLLEYGRIEGWRCRWGCSGMLKVTGGYKDIPLPRAEPREGELLEYKKRLDPWQERLKVYSGLLPYCGRCLCVCPLPRRGAVST
jgi:epoxyqueuosine reductase QueG